VQKANDSEMKNHNKYSTTNKTLTMANSNGIAFGNNYGPITTANTMGKGKGSQILRRTM